MGQIARTTASERKENQAIAALLSSTNDNSPAIRKAALETLDNIPTRDAIPAFTRCLADDDATVRAAAALGISRYADAGVTSRLVRLASDNDDRDPVLRHGGMMALAGTCTADELVALRHEQSPAVRRAAVVALRRQRATQVAEFLHDQDPTVVNEAALAIHDVPITAAFSELANFVASDLHCNDRLTRRILNANYRLGNYQHALAVASVLGRKDVTPAMQLEALAMLNSWATPSNRDRVLGDWRPLGTRSAEPAIEAMGQVLERIGNCESHVAIEAVWVATSMGLKDAADAATGMIGDDSYDAQKRAKLFRPLARLKPNLATALVDVGLGDKSRMVRAAARDLLVLIDVKRAVPQLVQAVRTGSVVEQQAAFASLAEIGIADADEALREVAKSELLTGKLPKEVLLDAVAAIQKRRLEPAIQSYLDELARRPYGHAHLAAYGGDAERGMDVFQGNVTLSCSRCHKAGRSGGRVGPNLAGLGATKSPEYLLESVVDPNKVIAEGFGTLVVITEDGLQKLGVLQKETKEYVQLVDGDGKQFLVMKSQIVDRANGKSAMPEDLTKELSLFDLRDLVAFLHSLKTPWHDPAGHD